jgi:dinuclear metal center YbgI/SA1388 family protein
MPASTRPASAPLRDIVHYADQLLKHAQLEDYPGAKNGLQIENNGAIHSIAAAVDANPLTIEAAVNEHADLLIVHHGVGWQDLCPLTGGRYQWLRRAFAHNLALYSSHLPLDSHPSLGNSTLLCQALGFVESTLAFPKHGQFIGRVTDCDLSRDALTELIENLLREPCRLIQAGPHQCRRLGVVSGAGGSLIHEAARLGCDTLLTGEGAHWTFSAAHELGLNLIYAGHYRTETFGVQALARDIATHFRLPWRFIDIDSHL